MSDRKPHKSDLSDERWALIEPVTPAWKAKHPSVSGHQGNYEMREIVNALLSRTGCQWDYLPPPGAVKHYFTKGAALGSSKIFVGVDRPGVRQRDSGCRCQAGGV
ncbi:transposase [Streptomyces sp. NPDC016845]|uniref:transposase n=1 Tax=Streptomyces sp. NPDC016845 TaxID=3364972 RepID=UPI0037AAD8D7